MIIGIDGTNWIHSLWHTVGLRAPELAAERLSCLVEYFADKLAGSPAPRQGLHLVVCWDRRSFRHDLYPEYKAKRKPKDAGLFVVLERGPQVLSADALQLAVDGFEADDLLASLAAAAIVSHQQAVLCSGDHDLYQCVRSGSVSILQAFKTEKFRLDGQEYSRAYDLSWVTESTVMTRYALRPDQWVDYQCLVGESGDNVPGCPGWGEKWAKAGLLQCDSVAAMLAMLQPGTPSFNPWKVPGGKAKHKSLLAWKDQYPTTRQLIELRADVWEVWDCLR